MKNISLLGKNMAVVAGLLLAFGAGNRLLASDQMGIYALVDKVVLEPNDSGRSKLFDLRADPAERFDLSGQEPALVATYRSHLLRWCGYQREKVTSRRSPG